MRRFALLFVFGVAALFVTAATSSADGVQGDFAQAEGLVFERNFGLYAMAINGSRVVRLTRTSAREGRPAVSPDGRRIAYSRSSELWLMNFDGTGQKRLLAAARGQDAWTGNPAWSPDGRTIFFDRGRETDEGFCGSLFQIGVDGGGLRLLARHPSGLDYAEPAVSPDGKRVAFSHAYCDPTPIPESRLVVVDLAGHRTGDLRKLRRPAYRYYSPAWSPDGQRLALGLEAGADTPPAVYTVDRDGSGLTRVTPRAFLAEGRSAWSPDGRWIAFTGSRMSISSESNNLYVIHPDGTGLRRLAWTTGDEWNPAWLPRLPGH